MNAPAPVPGATTHHTAATLAAVLGLNKRSVLMRLKAVTPAAVKRTRGGNAAAWSIEQLPEEWRAEIARRIRAGELRGHVVQILQPDGSEQTRITFDEIAERILEDATAAARPESRPASKPTAGALNELAGIKQVIESLRDSRNPSPEGLACLWMECGKFWEAAEQAGRQMKRVRRKLVEFLFAAMPTLAKNPESMRKLVGRKIKQWKVGDRRPDSVMDQRARNSGRAPAVTWTEEEEKHLIAQSVLAGGDVAKGIRRAIKMGVISRCLADALSQGRKGYVLPRLRGKILPIVRELHKEHSGSRKDRLDGPYVHGDWWSKEHPYHAGDQYVFDDLTGNVYFWVEDDGRPRLLLGQFLAGCDGRSLRLFPGAVVPSNVYNQLACRTAMNGMVQQFGIPRVGFILENGLWKTGQLIKGQSVNSLKHLARDLPEFTSALGNLGIRIRHTEPGNPRGKIIERVFGLIQPRLESLKGYAGRLQLLDIPETTRKAVAEVNSGRAHPSKYFLSFEQMIGEYRAICEEYNAERQEGEILRGMSPDQGWVNLQNPDEPLGRLDPKLSHCFAHEKFVVRVRKYQLRIPISGHYYYRAEEIWKLNDTEVCAWFDPLRPESVIITDLNGENPVVADRISKVPKYVPGENHLLAKERAKCRSITKHRKATLVSLNNELSIPYRGHLVDEQTVAKVRQGEEFSRIQKESAAAKQQSKKVNAGRARIGLPPTRSGFLTDEQAEATARLARDLQQHRQGRERMES